VPRLLVRDAVNDDLISSVARVLDAHDGAEDARSLLASLYTSVEIDELTTRLPNGVFVDESAFTHEGLGALVVFLAVLLRLQLVIVEEADHVALSWL
jgi:hypothetical protein